MSPIPPPALTFEWVFAFEAGFPALVLMELPYADMHGSAADGQVWRLEDSQAQVDAPRWLQSNVQL
jgi:hypothetical protein